MHLTSQTLKVLPCLHGVAEKEVAITDGEVCIICQTLANYAGEALKEQSTVEEVEKLLGDICTILPDNLGSTVSTCAIIWKL